MHVPNVAELVKMKLAIPAARTAKGTITAWRILPEGQRLIYEAMHANAVQLREEDEGRRRRTPPTPRSRWDAGQ